ncbi:hypothetical protein [Candidatus Symbiopectobacterium sp. NZEC151]|nr:hypothetical protein [Candidatus Symbiopectobacterium sp. NZEC151]MCW2477378.1 hypothetical protein [Candidatus Symbiopectobacterium sp. NZEC151]
MDDNKTRYHCQRFFCLYAAHCVRSVDKIGALAAFSAVDGRKRFSR